LVKDVAVYVLQIPFNVVIILSAMICQDFQAVEVCVKSLRQLVLSRTDDERIGFTVEAELGEDREDELRVFVSDVQPHGAAHRCGQ